MNSLPMASDTVVGTASETARKGYKTAQFIQYFPYFGAVIRHPWLRNVFFLENDGRWLAGKRHVIRDDGLRRLIITVFTVSWSVGIVSHAVFLDLGSCKFVFLFLLNAMLKSRGESRSYAWSKARWIAFSMLSYDKRLFGNPEIDTCSTLRFRRRFWCFGNCSGLSTCQAKSSFMFLIFHRLAVTSVLTRQTESLTLAIFRGFLLISSTEYCFSSHEKSLAQVDAFYLLIAIFNSITFVFSVYS